MAAVGSRKRPHPPRGAQPDRGFAQAARKTEAVHEAEAERYDPRRARGDAFDTALLAALVASGLPTDSFFFAGFPPRKTGARRLLFTRLDQLGSTLIFYESPHRVGTTLAELAAVLGEKRPACLARELTKTHEELVRGTLGELAQRYAETRPLGEVTLVVAGATDGEQATDDDDTLVARAKSLIGTGMSARDVADALAGESQRPRRDIYQLVLAVKR